ncbi:MAG: hypothetical protein ACWA40_06400 [Planktomarina sp.]
MQDYIDGAIKCLEDNAVWLGSLAALIAIIGVPWAILKFFLGLY